MPPAKKKGVPKAEEPMVDQDTLDQAQRDHEDSLSRPVIQSHSLNWVCQRCGNKWTGRGVCPQCGTAAEIA